MRFLPVVAEHQVVPLGDDVAEGTAVVGLAEWNATVHAPGAKHTLGIASTIN